MWSTTAPLYVSYDRWRLVGLSEWNQVVLLGLLNLAPWVALGLAQIVGMTLDDALDTGTDLLESREPILQLIWNGLSGEGDDAVL